MKDFMYTAFCVLSGLIAYLLGGVDKLLIFLIALITIDYLTGILQAIHNQCLSSEIGWKGIVRKISTLSIVALAFIIESITEHFMPLREITIMFFIANEGISIIENVAKMGVPIPKKLISILEQLESKGDEEDDDSNSTDGGSH